MKEREPKYALRVMNFVVVIHLLSRHSILYIVIHIVFKYIHNVFAEFITVRLDRAIATTYSVVNVCLMYHGGYTWFLQGIAYLLTCSSSPIITPLQLSSIPW